MTVENLDIEIAKSGADAVKSIEALADSIKKIKAPTASVTKNVKGLSASLGFGSTAAGKFVKSLGRIAFYRAIRTVVKEITQSFKEGLKNAYNFSKAVGYDLARTMDTLATKSLTMKNQMGSAFGGLIQAVEPILLRIIALATQAANALAALFGAFTTGQYLKAKDVATGWDEAAGAAGAYKRTILGFDEINRLDSPSGGGGGASSNFADMFEVTDVPEWAMNLRDIVSDIKFRINNVFGEWGNWDTEKIKETILKNIPTIAGCTIIGATIGGVKGALIGLTVGLALSFLKELFSADGKIDASSILDKIELGKVLPIAGALIGWKFGKLGGAAIGLTLGTVISLLFGDKIGEMSGQLDFENVLEGLTKFVLPVSGAILGWNLGKLGGAAIGLTLGILAKLAFNNAVETEGGFTWDTLWSTLYNSGVLPIGGAIIGWKLGGFNGALVGFTLGSIVSFFIKDMNTEGVITAKQLCESIITNVLPAVAGFVAGFMVGGVAGALIGMTIGVALSFVVKSVDLPDISTDRESYAIGAQIKAETYTSGGFPSRGDLFIAGEAGAEIVSSHGGQTQVSNTDQIAYSVQAGNGVVVDAIYAMANAIVSSVDRKDTRPVVTIGDREVYHAWERGISAVGGSLVHG